LIKQLLSPFEYYGYQISFKIYKGKADNSTLAKNWENQVGGHLRCCFCSANFSKEEIISYKYCCEQREKTLNLIMESIQNNNGIEFGISFLPGILLDDSLIPLVDRGLDEYEKAHDRLHNTKGHMNNMYELFAAEPGFNKVQAINNLVEYVGRDSFKENMKGSDWRYYFVLYEKTLLPCISYKQDDASFIIQTWLEIQYICYQGMLFKRKTRKLELRFWIVTFLRGLCVVDRWGKSIMSLYLHNIWIHWPKDFKKIDFSTRWNRYQ